VVARQGAGLVDAEHGSGTQGLDGSDLSRQYIDLRQTPGAEREEYGQHDRELFGEHRHCHGDPSKTAFFPRIGCTAPGQGVNDGDQSGCHDGSHGEPANDALGLILQACSPGADAGERATDAGEFGMNTCTNHFAQAVAGRDQRA
jgi:hypothetical protein